MALSIHFIGHYTQRLSRIQRLWNLTGHVDDTVFKGLRAALKLVKTSTDGEKIISGL